MSDKTVNHSKIASAIYLITGFFADQEPLKWRLRSLSADLVGEARDKAVVAREMSALFEVARNANLISEANHDIIVRELGKIASSGEERVTALLESAASPSVPEPEPVSLPRIEASPSAPLAPAVSATLPVVKDTLPERHAEDKPTLKEFGAVSVKKNSRQSVIIGLLKRKKEIMIKDVSPLIAGCSEKTIQRELLDMVSQGILKKIGEKRWTRYTLA